MGANAISQVKLIRSAEILCVGTELLLGEVVNTNATDIAKALSTLGISVFRQAVVGDNPQRLREAFERALSRCDLVILSGGLGPTCDDLTRETVAESLGLPLVLDPVTLGAIKGFFERRDGGLAAMTDNNVRQAMVPEGATVLANPNGTAPGLALDTADGKLVILLPGPPRELRPMLTASVLPLLTPRTHSVLVSHSLHIIGMGESAVESVLRGLMNESDNPTVAPYAGDGEVRVRITAKAPTAEAAERMMVPVIDTICATSVGKYIYGMDVNSLEEALVRELTRRHLTIAVAESCTGGMLAKRLTDIPGASAVFRGGMVTYTGEAKTALVGVSPQTLADFGEVSRETAAAMAKGARERLGVDIALSTTGFAGPGGGTEKDPRGTVYVGISTVYGEAVKRLSLSPDRSRDYTRTVASSRALAAALETVRQVELEG